MCVDHRGFEDVHNEREPQPRYSRRNAARYLRKLLQHVNTCVLCTRKRGRTPKDATLRHQDAPTENQTPRERMVSNVPTRREWKGRRN